ncbi:MAG: anti-sigma factor family protein [Gemmatimonadales bacterium]
MSDLPVTHLSADDLDAWLEGRLGSARSEHLRHCARCYELVERERDLVDLLGALPRFAPRTDLADQVLARVRIPRPASVRRAFAIPRISGLAAALLGVTLVGMGASVAWSLGNRELLELWGARALEAASQLFWVSVQAVASSLLDQPWFRDVRSFVFAPGRLLPVLGAASLVYASGLLVLKRLMALPTTGVANAR